MGADTIEKYNTIGMLENSNQPKISPIILIVYEFAQFIDIANEQIESMIRELAEKGAPFGIHLVLTAGDLTTTAAHIGTNIPSRIAFQVNSAEESHRILNTSGAERLIGHGDMIYVPNDRQEQLRVQGCRISSEEIGRVVHFLKEN